MRPSIIAVTILILLCGSSASHAHTGKSDTITIRGRVVFANSRRPISDARITLVDFHTPWFPFGIAAPPEFAETRADRNGRFIFRVPRTARLRRAAERGSLGFAIREYTGPPVPGLFAMVPGERPTY